MFRSPLFSWSPRSEQNPFATPPSDSPSRFGAFQSNIRTMINGSSIYSQSPALGPSNNNTPKAPFLGIFGRQTQSPDLNVLPTSHGTLSDLPEQRSPLRPQHTAGSYIRTIAPLHDPQEPTTIYNRHPADVPLPSQQQGGYVDPEVQQLADEINSRRRRRRKHRRRKHHNAEHWVRRRNERNARGVMLFVKGTAARGKMIACIISGTILVTVLSIYLAIALTKRDLGQEIHILFIMLLLAITIFFCHSLIRLCMLMLNPPRDSSRPQIPSMTGSEGFQPIVPIRVHLARDEEEGLGLVEEQDVEEHGLDYEDPEKGIPPPPPAYGLWRSSVRADPNLLHWQRVGNQDDRGSMIAHSRSGSATRAITGPSPEPAPNADGPRPPSYVSEDGVSYIVEAAPRSIVNNNRQSHSGVSDIHPAWRPGYAMSEIRGTEPGMSTGRRLFGAI